MTVHLSPAALDRARRFIVKNPLAFGLRLSVRQTGCSGYAYEVVEAVSRMPDDRVCTVDGLPVIVDAKSAPLLEGVRVDVIRQGLNTVFVFDNPQETGRCGCGESVALSAHSKNAS